MLKHGKFEGESFVWVCKNEMWYVKFLCRKPAGQMVRYFDLIKYAKENGYY